MALTPIEMFELAMSKVGPDPTLAQVKEIAEVEKILTETIRLKNSSDNVAKERRNDLIKAWGQGLVPIVSILGAFFAFWIGSQQLNVSIQQNEDKQWRDFLSSVSASYNKSNDSLSIDPTVPAQIKSFLHSDIYKAAAIDLAKRMAGHIANYSAFNDLLDVAFPQDKGETIDDIIDLDKSIHQSQLNIVSSCVNKSKSYVLPITLTSGICDYSQIPDGDVNRYARTPDELSEILHLRAQYLSINQELGSISLRIANFLRKNSVISKLSLNEHKNLFSGVYFIGVDLSGLSFISVDLSNTFFEFVNLSNSTLDTSTGRVGEISNSNWWDAAKIDYSTLIYLMSNFYPGYVPEYLIGSSAIKKEDYLNKIYVLCHLAGHDCYGEELKFNEKNILTQSKS
jgi:hypothetical protein